ncbi:MAG TPA: flavodoxin family protein [Methanomassiliicoccales archaeon]|jgi:flavodoxin
MKALVLFDSKYGNTEKIAQAIATGLREGGIEPVECRALSASGEEDFRGKDLWVLGTPTHYGSVPFRFSALLKNALKEDHLGVQTAVFDTRMKDFPKGAESKLRKILEKKGKPVIADASFVVAGMRGPLEEGEEEKARLFGRQIADLLQNK